MMRRLLGLFAVSAVLVAPLQGTAQEDVGQGTGAQLRGLDKINATTRDLDLAIGERGRVGSLEVTLRDCRYPLENPAGDAYAFLTIRDMRAEEGSGPVFDGWMIASSPALNALDHFRYDIWVLGCDLPAGAGNPAEAAETDQAPD